MLIQLDITHARIMLAATHSVEPDHAQPTRFPEAPRAFDSLGFGGCDDRDGRLGRVMRDVVRGAFEGPAGDFSFDDTGVGSSPSWWEQAVKEFSERGFDGAGESAGGKMPPAL
jgi:hypothetical protein